jgi:hypothetical protein
MDDHDRHVGVDWAKMLAGVGLFLLGLFFAVMVMWMVLSQQDSKLYEADNVVCVSQPFAVNCFERK